MQNLGISFGSSIEHNHEKKCKNMTEYRKSDASKLVSTSHMVGNFYPDVVSHCKLDGIDPNFGHELTQKMLDIFDVLRIRSQDKVCVQDCQQCTIQQLVFAHYQRFKIMKEHDNNSVSSRSHTFSAEILPRPGADGSLVDLPAGLGKTMTTILGGLLYVLLDFQNLQNDYKKRCVMQTHSNIIQYNESTIYRNIIAICCPVHLMANWENQVNEIIKYIGEFVKTNFHKVLKRYTFVNVDNIDENIGKDNEIAFVIFKNKPTGTSMTLSLKSHSCPNAPKVDDRIYVSHPVLINDESHQVGSQFNRKLYTSNLCPRAAHYIAVTATPNIADTVPFSVNEYIMNWVNLSRYHKNNSNLVAINVYFACKTDYLKVKEFVQQIYSKITIHEIHMKTLKSSHGFGSELDQFQSRDHNFASFQRNALSCNISIPNDWVNGFSFEKLKTEITEQINKLDNIHNLREASNEMIRKKRRMEGFLKKMTEEKEACPICLDEFEFPEITSEQGSKKRKHDETLPEIIFVTCCRQKFHKNCYQKCIERTKNCCPMCKQTNNGMVNITKPSEEEISGEKEVFIEPPLLDDPSMDAFSEFLKMGWYDKKSILPYSMHARLEQLVYSLLHYMSSFPQSNLQFLLVSDSENMNSFKEVLKSMIPDDQADLFEIREHKNKGNQKNKMTLKKNKENLRSFMDNKKQGISILFCNDQDSTDSLVGLDLGTIDGILCFGDVGEVKKHQRIGRIVRFTRAISTEKNHCLYIQLG